MTHTTLSRRASRLLTHAAAAAISLCAAIAVHPVSAAVFDGGGIEQGLGAAGQIKGVANGSIRGTIIRVITTVLDLLGVVAVAMVIIAGIYYIISMGEEDRKEKGKKMIQYTLIGLGIVLFSRTIVGLVTEYLAGQIS